MKIIFGLLAFLFLTCVMVSVPAGIGYSLYQWAIIDVELKVALWAGFILWVKMFLCLIPGAICYVIVDEIK